MKGQDQLELQRTPASEKEPVPHNSSPKTILLHVQDDESLDTRIENALSVARACSAHVQCLHVTPIEAYVAFDTFGGIFVMNDVIKSLDEQEAKLRTKVEDKFQAEDVSWDYVQVTGNVAAQLIGRAALADLLITTRAPHRSDFVGPTVSFLGDLICRSRTSLLIPVEDGPPCDPTGSALIAWDGSYEAANAIRSSIALLGLSSSVHVLQIVDEEKTDVFPSTQLLEYLSRHGVHAELSVLEAGVDVGDDEVISATIAARAKALRSAYLVMGGYNHSRLGEYIFGGV
ncbi:MAG TPA: universal stress protein, partial [Nitrospiraceae bacterium]|nr:universal stress protein [Nitrospiraceae bacterium]